MSRKKIIIQWLQVAAGLLVFALGIYMTIYANIGLAPWDCLSVGISRRTPLNLGAAVTLVSVFVFGIDLFLKERIGFGTVMDTFLTGPMIQFFQDVNPLPENRSIPVGIIIMLTGFVFMAVGMRIYMGGGAVLRAPGRAAGRTGKKAAVRAHRLCGDPFVVSRAAGGMAAWRTGGDRHGAQHLRSGRHYAGGLFGHQI